EVAGVRLVTRAVTDRRVDASYGRPSEQIAPRAWIVRIPFGPRRYLRKESLWPHLDSMVDQLARHVRVSGRVPDVVHGHYADAGYVGAQLSKILGVPFVFTGHSLGRVKRARLLADDQDPEAIEERFHFLRRIEAEEQALETAAVVITSTRQEVHEQYQLYDHYRPERMHVIPPGVDLSRFGPPPEDWSEPPIVEELARFLKDPTRPIVLAIARPDERKNFAGLIEAYARTPGLREVADLVLVPGNRDDLREMPAASRRVIYQILELIDRHDLYGNVAYPKRHRPSDVPDLYRWAARSGGVFVNPALTEPFGLTLLEAAASGLPVVTTDDGGPADIVGTCENGLLVDPLDPEAIGRAIADALRDRERWRTWSRNGVERVHVAFSWEAHARRYVEVVGRVLRPADKTRSRIPARRLEQIDRMLVVDVDDTLTGDPEAVSALRVRMRAAGRRVAFCVSTGRTLAHALEALAERRIPRPDVLVTASGTELHYGFDRRTHDRSWARQIRYRWDRDRVREALDGFPGLEAGPTEAQTDSRLRYVVEQEGGPGPGTVRRHLRKAGLQATVLMDHETFLDVVPIRASPGLALRFLCYKWNIELDRLLVVGDSGLDADMLSGDTLGVVVANRTRELERLRGQERVYFAEGAYAWGVLEGIDHYDFFGEIRVPAEDAAAPEAERAQGAGTASEEREWSTT
ncbi:MAG TPA: HAD family hydrolase, partial [Longimicrobiales bacterium]|nr:HAD family hydrolase [Longimicrobiales bacterium]